MESTNTSKKKVLTWLIVVFSLVIVGFVGLVYWNNSKDRAATSTNTTGPSTQGSSVQGQSSSKSYSTTEVAKHDSSKDCWLIISNNVYDVSSFLSEHPGGSSMIVKYCGKEATKAFETQDRGFRGGHSSSAKQMLGDYLIGTLAAN